MRFQGCERLDQDMRVRVNRCDDSTNSSGLNRLMGEVNTRVFLWHIIIIRVIRCR